LRLAGNLACRSFLTNDLAQIPSTYTCPPIQLLLIIHGFLAAGNSLCRLVFAVYHLPLGLLYFTQILQRWFWASGSIIPHRRSLSQVGYFDDGKRMPKREPDGKVDWP
jgi:hypothetical protein